MSRRRLALRAVWEGLQLASLLYAFLLVWHHLTRGGAR